MDAMLTSLWGSGRPCKLDTVAAGVAMRNSSSLSSWGPVALSMAVPMTLYTGSYWDPTGAVSGLSAYLQLLMQSVVSLLYANPAEALLCTLISAWAYSKTTRVGRTQVNRLKKKAKGIYHLAQKVVKQRLAKDRPRSRFPRRPSSGTTASSLSSWRRRFSTLNAAAGSSSSPSASSEAPKTGFSLQILPGFRVVLEWASSSPEAAACTSPPLTPRRLPMPGQGKDGCLLKGYALDDDDDDLSESTPAAPPSSSAFSWIWRRSRPGDTSAATNNKQGSTEQSSSSVPSSGHHGSLLSHSYSMPAMPHSSASPPPPIGAYCSNPALGPGHMLEGLQAPSQKEVPKDVLAAIPDKFMLQFAALIGEEAATAELKSCGLPPACTAPDALFGLADKDCAHLAWEEQVHQMIPGALEYRAFKRPLRRGINMYFTVTTFERSSAHELRCFNLDDHNRLKWDDNCLDHRQLEHDYGPPKASDKSCFLYTKTKFPRPMAGRGYLYARRVVERPCGGCYIAQALPSTDAHPAPPSSSYGRTVEVTDFSSCCSITEVPSPSGLLEPAAQITLIHFEDSQVRPGLLNMAVSKGLWAFVQRQEQLFRCYQTSLNRKSQDLSQVLSRLAAGQGPPDGVTSAPPPVPSPPQHPKPRDSSEQRAAAAFPGGAVDGLFANSPAVMAAGISRDSSIDFSSLPGSLRPRSRRARWSRRLLVAVVLGSHVMSIVTGH